jgi:hypothetical protein
MGTLLRLAPLSLAEKASLLRDKAPAIERLGVPAYRAMPLQRIDLKRFDAQTKITRDAVDRWGGRRTHLALEALTASPGATATGFGGDGVRSEIGKRRRAPIARRGSSFQNG